MDDIELRDIRVCIDRKVPPKTANERMALVKGSLWPPNIGVTVSFLDGEEILHQRVRDVARQWEDYVAQLRFFFRDGVDRRADIRISFTERGSWSYIGTDCLSITGDRPTMNFGWLSATSPEEELRRVVLHEFGHALGCLHEHQNPAGGIKWNKDAVYAYYAGPPNYWSKEDVDHNLFDVYNKDLTVYTSVDPRSIMMYPIDRRFTLDGLEVRLNTDLSDQDKRFIGGPEAYG
ncbi:hypothetical protein SAMN05660657_04457 [Geodermatophilus amargosae]|uniref:Peptidase metallopeptidase domain-containing protein n=1 Tax=Geodermatophilus amargosae TaxID=1296565 RepID=A0A1I7CGI6_9ACTN|nr:hypothetical protein [Geodermatophilus amargosae]SFT98548.1 hypothetical protein SAMN05660657_04457 [Geodermatophilus amargosae]